MIASKYNETWTLYVADTHGEYALPDPTTIKKVPHKGGFGEFPIIVETVWDTNAMEALFKLDVDGEPMRTLLSHLPDPILPYCFGTDNNDPGLVHRITGTKEQIAELLTTYMTQLGEGPKGADDDCYDYWPGAMDMAWQIACDLDHILHVKRYTKLVSDVSKAVHKMYKDDPEMLWETPSTVTEQEYKR